MSWPPDRFRPLGKCIFEALHPAPMVAWYGGIQVVPASEVLPSLLRARDSAGIRRLAFVAAEDLVDSSVRTAVFALSSVQEQQPTAAVSGKVTRFETESVELEVEAPSAGVVVLNEVSYPGWKVFVDGREATPLKVDLLLRGVLVEAGHHRIKWIYEPRLWRALIGLWAAGLLTFVAVSIWSIRTHRPGRVR